MNRPKVTCTSVCHQAALNLSSRAPNSIEASIDDSIEDSIDAAIAFAPSGARSVFHSSRRPALRRACKLSRFRQTP